MSEVQKDSEDVFAGIGIFFKVTLFYKFSRNLRSKSARSTLTSPGPIRVKKYLKIDVLYIQYVSPLNCFTCGIVEQNPFPLDRINSRCM
jgi:hypothetical protein